MQAVFDAWLTSTARTSRTVLSPKRRRLIVAALKAYPLDDVLAAVDGWRFSPFHRGENVSRTVYNDLTVLLRDAGQIEKFRDLRHQAAYLQGQGVATGGVRGQTDRDVADLLQRARQRQIGAS